jgi:hypothetical protein
LAELAQTLEVSADKIAPVGDVWAPSHSQSLNNTAKALEHFVGDPTMDKYTALRISIENTLCAGDLGSKLLATTALHTTTRLFKGYVAGAYRQ